MKDSVIENKKPNSFNFKFVARCFVGCFAVLGIVVAIMMPILAFNNINSLDDMFLTAEQIRITNDTFVDTIIKNSKMKLNKNYYLDEKITLDSDKISKLEDAGELHFYGTLDGRGNEIQVDAIMTKPLFHQITAGSTVKQMVINNAEVKNRNAQSIAILTNINNGTIENVKVSNAKVHTDGVSVAGGIAAYNFNEINYCIISVYFEIDSDYTNPNQLDMVASWNCAIGAISGTNGGDGRIDGAIVAADFTNDFVVLTRQSYKNTLVGYSVGNWNNSEALSDIHIIDATYVITAHDICELKTSGKISLKSLNELTADKFTRGKWNEKDGWKFDAGKLPSLKDDQMLEE